ncbi:MAG TPA: GntR family transcriptional regulator [Variovorax sp.]|nr:GntR family transcriptional regulator [Variovorax sp.]
MQSTTSRSSAPAPTPISKTRRERGSGVFEALRDMAISYQLKPGERLSEIELAQRLGVSRTPVREALTRLVNDGFLLPATRGFVRRPLDVQETLDLYEARVAIESACLSLAIQRATDEEIAQAKAYLAGSQKAPADAPVEQLVELDEGFHLRIADMARNQELRRMLGVLNERIRFIRWIDMENVGRNATQKEHLQILKALAARDETAAQQVLKEHIGLRKEQIVDAIAKGLARIYLPAETAGG